jgi:hypothetical protein
MPKGSEIPPAEHSWQSPWYEAGPQGQGGQTVGADYAGIRISNIERGSNGPDAKTAESSVIAANFRLRNASEPLQSG